uniref:Putative kazal domain protein n=1 Tax=Rhipicephalus microplus TaxID=6941 RepID=A0A6G5A4I1_RHIMP
MNILTKHFVVFTLFLMRPYWQPLSNEFVDAGRVVFGPKDCWRHTCWGGLCPSDAPSNCECPSPIEAFFGIKNCR